MITKYNILKILLVVAMRMGKSKRTASPEGRFIPAGCSKEHMLGKKTQHFL